MPQFASLFLWLMLPSWSIGFFQPVPLIDKYSRSQQSLVNPLFLSDIPKPEQKKDSKVENDDDDWLFLPRFSVPPPPEDEMILMGDLLSIFVYGFSDHILCHDLAKAQSMDLLSQTQTQSSSSQSLLSMGTAMSSTTTSSNALSFPSHPVWLDHSHSFAPNVLQVVHESQSVTHYSPLLQDAGLAACVLASAWLLGGWLGGAFLRRNTLECSTPQALAVMAKAWLVTCCIMLYVVATTSWLNDAILQAPLEWNGFTKGDADYILDSLIVIALWRWLASNLLGTGGGGGSGRGRDGGL